MLQFWEVVLIFVGIPAAVCLLITATVFALTSSNGMPEGTARGVAQGADARSASGNGAGNAANDASGEDVAAGSAEPHSEPDGSEVRSPPQA